MPLWNTLRQDALLFMPDGKTQYALKWFKLGKIFISLAVTQFIFLGECADKAAAAALNGGTCSKTSLSGGADDAGDAFTAA